MVDTQYVGKKGDKQEVPPSEYVGKGDVNNEVAAVGVTHRLASRATALQKHVSFFDRHKRGVIYPWDSYSAMRALGFNPIFAVSYAVAFHLLHTSYWTTNFILPNPLLPVYVERIHWAKHGSDTETYDREGNFAQPSFRRIFDKFDREKKGGLYYSELIDMMKYNRDAGDVLGWSFQFFLWSGLWLLAADSRTGILSREDILAQYDGTLFYQIEARRKAGKHKLPIWRGGCDFSW